MKTELIVLGLIVVAITALLVVAPPQIDVPSDELKTFTSHEELNEFVKANAGDDYGLFGTTEVMRESATQAQTTGAPAAGDAKVDYSTTNVQVQGVDEADIVKTDGEYLYVISGNSLIIVSATPAVDAEIVSQIDFDNTISEIFVNGNKLVVFGNYFNQQVLEEPFAGRPSREIAYYPYYSSQTLVQVYDITDKTSPTLARNLTLDGNYFDSRMIDNNVYAIINQPFSLRKDVVPLPAITEDGTSETVQATEINYFDSPAASYRFVTILAIDVENDERDVSRDIYMMGHSENLYVSENNIYITYTKRLPHTYYTERLIEQVLIPLVPANTAGEMSAVLASGEQTYEKMQQLEEILGEYFNTLSAEEKSDLENSVQERTAEYYIELAKETQKTVIHKIGIDNGNVEYKSRGEVPGTVLNQFSMDEHNGNFRIATTLTNFNQFGITTTRTAIAESTAVQTTEAATDEIILEQPAEEPTEPVQIDEEPVSPPVSTPERPSPPRSFSNVYVLDENLNIIGELEEIAPNERIYSARFMGDRLYLVTFVQIDPLFVIDLSNPQDPKVLGELKIPGVSQYLHPFDENHIIGVGKDAMSVDEFGRQFALFQGVKLSLFDVSDVANPVEKDSFIIGDRGTDSEVLRDHKAFLFDRERELLVIPIQLFVDEESTPGRSSYGEYKHSGAYVFTLNADGFELRDVVIHHERDESDLYFYGNQVRRSLYIEDVLYTISNTLVKMNNLDDLSEINTLELPNTGNGKVYPLGGPGGGGIAIDATTEPIEE